MRRSRSLLLVILLFALACEPQVLRLGPFTDEADASAEPERGDLRTGAGPRPSVIQPTEADYFVATPVGDGQPSLGGPHAVVVWVVTDGIRLAKGPRAFDNSKKQTSDLLVADAAEIPALDTAPWGDDRGAVIAALLAGLADDFADWAVHFTTTRPASGDYVLLALGGKGDVVGRDPLLGGIAPLDVGDENLNDVVLVFAQLVGEYGYDVRHLAWVAAHELGHSLGLAHVDKSDDIMHAVACHCPMSWGEGSLLDAAGQPTAERQDDRLALSGVLLPRAEALFCPADDALEPDDDETTPVALGDDGALVDGIVCGADADWFSLPGAPGCVAEARLSFEHDDGNLNLRVLWADGSLGARSFSLTDEERVLERVGDDGQPRLKVYAVGGDDNTYTLETDAFCVDDMACPADDPYEPNDERGAAATRLYLPAGAVGVVCGGDQDLFRAWATKGCTVHVDVEFTHAGGDIDVKLERADGSVVARGTSVSDDEHIAWTADTSASYYARVYGYRNAENSYGLWLRQTCP